MKKLEAEMFVSAPLFDRSETVCITTKLFHFLSLLIWCSKQLPSTTVHSERYSKVFILFIFCAVGNHLIIFLGC